MKTGHKKIGIMGGTFNPIHIGHLILGETAYEEFSLDLIWYMPSGIPYYKKEIASGEHRKAMTALAVSKNPRFHLSDLELNRFGNTYTCDTISWLKEHEPESELFFIMGEDSLFHLEGWKNPEIIFGGCVILAAVREDSKRMEEGRSVFQQIEYLKSSYQADVRLLHTPRLEISSAYIREKIKQGESIRYYVPDEVERYIYRHNLYQ